MKVGLIARADDRGLGHLTWEFARALDPDRVLVVDFAGRTGFPNRLDRFPGATVMGWDPDTKAFADLPGALAWLDGLDVVYSAETFYDWRIVERANELGIATVLHVMPELLHDELPAEPTQLWAPTSWRLDYLPAGTKVVPVPIAHFAEPAPREPGPLRVLHVAGRRAAADRNGTVPLYRALRQVTAQVDVTVTTQDASTPHFAARSNVRVTVVNGRTVADYWRLYDGHDVLVLPRKYGGLCLPVQEAAAAGLAIVMTDVAPNRDYPIVPVKATARGTIETACGHLPLHEADPSELARVLDYLATTPAFLQTARETAYRWASRRSWEELGGLYRAELLSALRASQGERGAGASAG